MLVIVDLGIGNSASVANMIRSIGGQASISNDPEDYEQAVGLILPGVGNFDAGMQRIAELKLAEILNHFVHEQKKPILGICLGMQLLCRSSEEGTAKGLGWIDAECRRFNFAPQSELKIPCMGWNTIKYNPANALFKGLNTPRFYFVHSYHAVCRDAADSIASAEYGYEYTVAVQKDNIYGVQFHPEKSHKFGMQLLKNFSEMCT